MGKIDVNVRAEVLFRKALKEEKEKTFKIGGSEEILPDYIPFYNIWVTIHNKNITDLKIKSIRVYLNAKHKFRIGEVKYIKVEGADKRKICISCPNPYILTIFTYYDWEKYRKEKAVGCNNYYYQRFPDRVKAILEIIMSNNRKIKKRILIRK